MISINLKKGVSVLYVIFVVSILFAISFGISGILIPQVKMLSEIGNSVVAFYAADSGIEKVLIGRQNPDLTPGYYNGYLSPDITYEVFVTKGSTVENPTDCPSNFYYCIKSIGTYQNTKRAIEINY